MGRSTGTLHSRDLAPVIRKQCRLHKGKSRDNTVIVHGRMRAHFTASKEFVCEFQARESIVSSYFAISTIYSRISIHYFYQLEDALLRTTTLSIGRQPVRTLFLTPPKSRASEPPPLRGKALPLFWFFYFGPAPPTTIISSTTAGSNIV